MISMTSNTPFIKPPSASKIAKKKIEAIPQSFTKEQKTDKQLLCGFIKIPKDNKKDHLLSVKSFLHLIQQRQMRHRLLPPFLFLLHINTIYIPPPHAEHTHRMERS